MKNSISGMSVIADIFDAMPDMFYSKPKNKDGNDIGSSSEFLAVVLMQFAMQKSTLFLVFDAISHVGGFIYMM